MYHNSTEQTGDTLREYQQKAMSQEKIILAYMKSFSYNTLFAPSKMHKKMIIKEKISKYTPLTSIRRALKDMTDAGLLIKTDVMSMSIHNRPEHNWKLAQPVQLELV